MELNGKGIFGVFIEILRNETDYLQEDFVTELFKTLGVDTLGIDTRLKNWMFGRNQAYVNYFKNKEIKQDNCDNFLKFLEEKIGTRYKKIQKNFEGCKEKYPYIDLSINDQDEFFRGILNQFKDIVGLPPDKIAGTHSEQMIEIFKSAMFDCDLISILRNFDPGAGATRQAISFLETIQTKIENNSHFLDYRDEETETYQNIVAFAYAVDQYNRALNTREHSPISSYAILDIDILYIWKRLVTLYGEICGSNTLFAD